MSKFWILHNGVWKDTDKLKDTYMLNNFGVKLQAFDENSETFFSIPVGNVLGYFKGYDFPEIDNAVLGFTNSEGNYIFVKLPTGYWKYTFDTSVTPATGTTTTTGTTPAQTTTGTTGTTTTTTGSDETMFNVWQIVKPVAIGGVTLTLLYFLYKRFFTPAKERQTIQRSV